jgi:hypothetical protein
VVEVEVSDAGAREGCDRAAVGGAEDGCVVEGGVSADGECAGGECLGHYAKDVDHLT